MKIVDHIAVLVENLETSQEWYENVCGAELVFEDHENYADLPSDKGEIVHHRDGTTGCYVKDPDGNVVEFIHYNKECKKEMKI